MSKTNNYMHAENLYERGQSYHKQSECQEN